MIDHNSFEDEIHEDGADEDEADLDRLLDESEAAFPIALSQLLAPPADLQQTTNLTVERRLVGRSSLSLAVDVLTTGWQTLRMILGEGTPNHEPSSNDPARKEVRG
jgi:hypothetical protein